MEYIIKKVDDWILFLEKIDEMKEKYGSHIIHKGITNIEILEQNGLPDLKDVAELLQLAYQFDFRNLEVLKRFLIKIEPIYRFSNIREEILKAKVELGVESIAFSLLNQNALKKIDVYDSGCGFQKVYSSKRVNPYRMYNFKTNGIDTCVISECEEFIVDCKNYHNKQQDSRIFYTDDFSMKIEGFPSKEEMDSFGIKHEKNQLFSSLLSSLEEYFASKKVHLVASNPNQVYLKENMLNGIYYSTIRTDGIIFDENGLELFPSKIDLSGTTKILVRNADMVLISNILNKETQNIFLVVNPSFLMEYLKCIFDEKQEEFKKSIVQLMDNLCDKDASKLMLVKTNS